ncbi:MAG: hypothetical protein ACMG57_04815 [Candidatus Dojkabacteria bacterium]
MLPNEQLDLQKTLPNYFEILKFPYLIINYGKETKSAKEKATLLAMNREQILIDSVKAGVLDIIESRHFENIDIFPIMTITGTMYGRVDKWGNPHTNIVVSYPGTNGITDDEKFLIMSLINKEPYISREPKKPLDSKNLVLGGKSNVKVETIGLQPGYIGPLFNYNAEVLPISLERAFWDDHTHRPYSYALYEIALNNTTGLIIKPTALRAIRKVFFPQRQIYSILTDEVGIPAPRAVGEG